MVRIALPPPADPPDPIFHTILTGTNLFLLFDPTRHNTTATGFRYFGPLLRFDHHDTASVIPGPDPQHGVYYGGFSLSCCVVEVFGDTGLIICGDWHIAMSHVTRDVRLLDLRGSGAMRAGSVAALGKVPDHSLSQTWSRWFYERPEYQQPEGLLWYNAHNDEQAFVLYERAETALECPLDRILRLEDPFLRFTLEKIAETNNLTLIP